MSVYATYPLIPIVGAAFYTLLLLMPLIKKGQTPSQNRWLITVIAISILWEFSIFAAPHINFPNLSTNLLLLSIIAITGATSAFLEWRIPRVALILAGLAIISAFVVDFLAADHVINFPQIGQLGITTGTLLTYTSGLIIAALLLAKTWREYKATAFPWHANRLLFWFMILFAIFFGEFLQFFDNLSLILVGQILRFMGVLGMAYGIASFRIFDVRRRVLRAITFTIVNIISALPLIIAVLAALFLSSEYEDTPGLFTAVLITIILMVGFFLYEPYHKLVEKITFRYLRGESLNSNQIMRNYSQAISRTLDVQHLSLLIAGTLSELLESNRCALLLITKMENGRLEIEPIPGMGQISRKVELIPQENLFITTLFSHSQPILQYDLDFSPDFKDLGDLSRAWLKSQAMEVFVPIGSGDEMEGMIAIGPKISAVPYQPGELEIMQILADQTVVALQNARLYSELNEQNEQIRYLNIGLVEQNERLEIMDRVKSDFITIASHELRTPLTQVKGYSDILEAMNEENALTREQTREIIGHIKRATVQLEALITAMLDASQLDVDGMQLTFVKTRIDTIIRLASEPLAQAIRERRISVTVEGVDTLPGIYGDFKRLVQSFTNLIGNSVKYTPDNGSIHIKAQPLPSVNGDEFLEIVIKDTGIGIDPKYHELIFEKFFRIGDPQLHSTGSTKFKGAGPGLGLPIAKGVIEAHGGKIWVESAGEDEGRLPGSQFHILLPVKPPDLELHTDEQLAAKQAYLVG